MKKDAKSLTYIPLPFQFHYKIHYPSILSYSFLAPGVRRALAVGQHAQRRVRGAGDAAVAVHAAPAAAVAQQPDQRGAPYSPVLLTLSYP